MRRWIVLILSILVVTAAEGPVTVHAASQQKIVNNGIKQRTVEN